MFVCVPMCWYVHMCAGSHDSKKRTLDPLGFEAAVNCAGAGAGAGAENRAWVLLTTHYFSRPQFFCLVSTYCCYHCFQILSLSGLCQIILFSTFQLAQVSSVYYLWTVDTIVSLLFSNFLFLISLSYFGGVDAFSFYIFVMPSQISENVIVTMPVVNFSCYNQKYLPSMQPRLDWNSQCSSGWGYLQNICSRLIVFLGVTYLQITLSKTAW